MDAPARPAPVVALGADGRLNTDISCRACGYNLRGALPDGVCPECATAVGRSIHGDLLRFSDPQWVGRLSRGMVWIVAGIVINAVVLCLGVGTVGALVGTGRAPAALPVGLIWPIQFAVTLVSFYGYWQVTTPDPARSREEARLTARRLVRIAQVCGLCYLPFNLEQQNLPVVLRVPFLIIGGGVSIVGIFAIFIYGRQLALRIPDLKLAARTRFVMWGVAVCLMTGCISAVMIAVRSAPPGPIPLTLAVPLGVAGLGSYVFGLWSLLLIDRFRKAFKQAAADARLTWAAAA